MKLASRCCVKYLHKIWNRNKLAPGFGVYSMYDFTFTMLHCSILYSAVLCCTVLCCTVLYCTVHYSTLLYSTVLYCTVLCCAVLHCRVLNCTVLFCIVLDLTVLYCTVMWSTVLYFIGSQRMLNFNLWTKEKEWTDLKSGVDSGGQIPPSPNCT